MASPVITVEIAFATNPLAAPTWVDVSSYLVSIPLIKRGRQHELNRIEAGEAQVVLNNMDRRFDPTNVASPYYPNVLPMRRIRISATFSATTYRLFTCFIEGWPPDWPLDGTATASLNCVDGFKLLNLNKLSLALVSEFSGWATATLMAAAGWAAADYSASAGYTLITANTLVETPALQRLQDIVDAENGLAFIRGDGVLEFQNRYYRLLTTASNTSQGTFGDGGGAELPYTALKPSYDDSEIWNEVRITAAGGTTQISSDATSQDAYGKRTLSKSGLIIGDASGLGGATADAECASASAYLLSNYKDPLLRFLQITIAGHTLPGTLWGHVLNRTISDRITVKRRPPGGGAAISQECFIEAVEHHVGGDVEFWTTTWQLSPASVGSAGSYWVLDSITLSVLDSTTRLAY
jgi:hypothetical protein